MPRLTSSRSTSSRIGPNLLNRSRTAAAVVIGNLIGAKQRARLMWRSMCPNRTLDQARVGRTFDNRWPYNRKSRKYEP